MDELKLSGLFVWKSCVRLGYPVLESFLSSFEMTDEQVVCADWTEDPELERLCDALSKKFDTVRVVPFVWPESSPDGSAIGVASNYALAQARGDFVINIQADECWSRPLMEWMRDNWRDGARKGLECVQLKVLNTEKNAQFFQGGETWDGRKDTDVWRRGGMFDAVKKVGGAGYNMAIKMAKRCPAIKFARDGWTFDGCGTIFYANISNEYPIIHLHDMMRDHYIDIRRNAADKLWTDRKEFGFYKASADGVEATKDDWWDSPIWTATTSPFDSLLPDIVKPLIGKTRYSVNYSLLA